MSPASMPINMMKIAARISGIRLAFMTMPLSDRPDYGHGDAALPRGEEKVSFIRKTPNKEEYCVYSENNEDWSGGCYPSKSKAESRLKQVETMKHMKG